MTGSDLPIGPTAATGPTAVPFARVVAQTATPDPGTPPAPTTVPDATGGLGLAAALVALAFVGAIAVTIGGTLIAGWAAFRGGFLWLDVGPWQRRLFAVAAACFGLSLLAILAEVGPRLGGAFVAVAGVGVLATSVGVGWVLASNVRDWLRRRD